MITIHRDTVVYAMSAENAPVARAASGDMLRFETLDCFGGQLKSEADKLVSLDWNRVNPATGPVFVEGAQPGDVLKVEILTIELDDHGVMVDAPGEGVTGRAVQEETTRILPVENGRVRFNDKLAFPLRPMIGVIGTAPAEYDISTGTPGKHGGNMDCTQIAQGATLYLPVEVEGALLAMGDLHAAMGDGEVAVCGVEIAGAVTVRVTVMKECALPTPFLIDGEKCMTICSAVSVDGACVSATMAMHRFLTREAGLTDHDAGMVMSIAGNLRICQVVDPERTVRMELPLSVPEAYGYRFA